MVVVARSAVVAGPDLCRRARSGPEQYCTREPDDADPIPQTSVSLSGTKCTASLWRAARASCAVRHRSDDAGPQIRISSCDAGSEAGGVEAAMQPRSMSD